LIGVAIGLALVPRLTRAFVTDDHEGGRKTLDDGITLAMAFTLPAAVALFVIPFFVIDATVTRGAFTSEDAARTADVLRHFAWGVPAFVLAKVLTPPFFAREDTRRPMIYAITAVDLHHRALGAALFFGHGRGWVSMACWAWPWLPPACRPGSMSPCWAGPWCKRSTSGTAPRRPSSRASFRVLAASARDGRPCWCVAGMGYETLSSRAAGQGNRRPRRLRRGSSCLCVPASCFSAPSAWPSSRPP
jgi:hypothetical protein